MNTLNSIKKEQLALIEKPKHAVVDLKNFVKRRTRNTGYVLSKNNPYYANSDQIGYMLDEVLELAGTERMTQKQLVSMTNWIDSLKQTYLR